MRNIALTFFLLWSVAVAAQDTLPVDSALINTTSLQHELSTVEIVYVIRSAQNGTRADVTDSTIARLYVAGTLSDLLGSGGGVALKSVGPGALSTVSIRGANSMQTPVLWNGINLQNINNNTVDLSLLPVFVFDQVEVEPGSTSAAWGSGSIGGIIRVNSTVRPRVGIAQLISPYVHVRSVNEAGSFGTYMNGVQFGYARGSMRYDFRLYRQSARNDFTFHNIAVVNEPIEILQNAAMLQQGGMATVMYVSKSNRHSASLRTWVQETSREIPPTMLQTSSEATQRDYAWRTVSSYAYRGNRSTYNATIALIHEGLLWNPGYNAPLSNTNAWTMMTDINAVHYLNYSRFRVLYRASITTGLTGNWAMSEVTEFINRHEQFRAGAYFSYYRSCRRADEMQIMVREEVIDGRAIQPVGTIWYSLNLRDMISVKGCVSRNYRVPTFNDLYWTPGGNPDLKAETGWTEEMTVSAKFHGAMWKLNYSLTGYNRNVTNMITWVPNSSYWSPMNVNEVWSRGAEHRLRFEWRFGASARIILTGNADYVRSTYEKTDDPNDVALGKQLIYVPAWFGGSAFTFEGWKFFATYSYQYTDLRFTTRDHSEFVPGYGLHSAAVGYTLSRNGMQKHYEGNLFFRWNNIMNVDYQSVAWRPMPGRSFTMGLSLNFGNELPPRKNFKVRKT